MSPYYKATLSETCKQISAMPAISEAERPPSIREALERAELWLSQHPEGRAMQLVCQAALGSNSDIENSILSSLRAIPCPGDPRFEQAADLIEAQARKLKVEGEIIDHLTQTIEQLNAEIAAIKAISALAAADRSAAAPAPQQGES